MGPSHRLMRVFMSRRGWGYAPFSKLVELRMVLLGDLLLESSVL